MSSFIFRYLVVFTAVVSVAGLVPAAMAEDSETQSETVNLSFASGSPLTLTVASSCRKGKTVFRLTNTGNAWPGPAKLQVVEVVSGDVVSSRTMKLRSNQSAGFAIRPDSGSGDLRLRLEANWLPEPYAQDAGRSCS